MPTVSPVIIAHAFGRSPGRFYGTYYVYAMRFCSALHVLLHCARVAEAVWHFRRSLLEESGEFWWTVVFRRRTEGIVNKIEINETKSFETLQHARINIHDRKIIFEYKTYERTKTFKGMIYLWKTRVARREFIRRVRFDPWIPPSFSCSPRPRNWCYADRRLHIRVFFFFSFCVTQGSVDGSRPVSSCQAVSLMSSLNRCGVLKDLNFLPARVSSKSTVTRQVFHISFAVRGESPTTVDDPLTTYCTCVYTRYWRAYRCSKTARHQHTT